MNMLEEQKRLEDLENHGLFQELETGTFWKVVGVYHNIYKDVVMKLYDGGKVIELTEGSEDYYKKYKRIH